MFRVRPGWALQDVADERVDIGDYLEPDHEYFQLSQEELLERYLPSLTVFNPNFRPDWIKKTWLFRTTYAQPIPAELEAQKRTKRTASLAQNPEQAGLSAGRLE